MTGKECVCSGCKRGFADVVAFDKHRHYSKCAKPEERGLVKVKGVWCEPKTDPGK